jgi:hypothetical protein
MILLVFGLDKIEDFARLDLELVIPLERIRAWRNKRSRSTQNFDILPPSSNNLYLYDSCGTQFVHCRRAKQ